MADFCKQCSILMFGEDFGDLKAVTDADTEISVCEGCGVIRTDREGKCLDHTDQEHVDAILRRLD